VKAWPRWVSSPFLGQPDLHKYLIQPGMCHMVVWDVQYGKIRAVYNTAYYTNTLYDTSLV